MRARTGDKQGMGDALSTLTEGGCGEVLEVSLAVAVRAGMRSMAPPGVIVIRKR